MYIYEGCRCGDAAFQCVSRKLMNNFGSMPILFKHILSCIGLLRVHLQQYYRYRQKKIKKDKIYFIDEQKIKSVLNS